MKLWLIRHAQPEVAEGLCYGRLDMPANPGATQTAAHALAGVLPKNIRLIASPLQRCEQLAQALIGLRADLTFKTDPRLQEMHFGAWEGRPWNSVAKPELDAWTADFAGHAAGGHGENVSGFMQRVAAAFDETFKTGKETAWITHAGVIRAAGLLACGVREVQHARDWPADAPAYGQWRTLEI